MIRYGPGQNIIDLGGVLAFQGPRSLGVVPRTRIIYDSFSEDGVLLENHAPDINTPGGAWTILLNSWVVSGEVVEVLNNALGQAVIEAGSANVDISVVLSRSASGIAFRAIDSNNLWYAYPHTANGIRIFERTSGSNFTRATATGTTITYPATITVALTGNSITASISGITASYSSAVRNTITKHGMYTTGIAPVFDDFEIKA
jgi:hypothetical protein